MRRLGLRKAGGWPQITEPQSDGAIRTQASGSGAWIPCRDPVGSGRTPDRGSHTGLLIGNDALFSQIRHGVRGFPARTPFSTRLPLASPSHRSPRFKTVTAHGVRTAQLSPEDKAPVSLHGHQTHSRHPQNTYSALNIRRLSLKCSRSSLELVIGKGTPRPHTRWLGQAPEPTRIFDTQSRKTHCPAGVASASSSLDETHGQSPSPGPRIFSHSGASDTRSRILARLELPSPRRPFERSGTDCPLRAGVDSLGPFSINLNSMGELKHDSFVSQKN